MFRRHRRSPERRRPSGKITRVETDRPDQLRPGKLWTLAKDGQTLTCAVFDHSVKQREVRLNRDGRQIRAEACWTTDRACKPADRWRMRAIQNGWSPHPA
jgi:hypothetical protein